MKRLKLVFAVVLLLLALPFWRFADMLAIASPFDWPLMISLIIWFAIFVAIPAKLIFPKIKTWAIVLAIVCYGALAWLSSPLSNMASDDPVHNHCGRITFTGFYYPVRGILTDAYRDDLEARNQMCWVRKMITRVPDKFDLGFYSKLIHERLLKPEIKYRVSLPLIAALFVKINFVSTESNAPRNIYDSLHFWIDHYTEEISERNYNAWNWPHSSYIKFEYGLVEKNWQDLIDSIVLETN